MTDQNQPENVEYFKYLGSMITNNAKLNPGLPGKSGIQKKKALYTSKLDLNLRKKLVKCCNRRIKLCDTELWTLRKVNLNTTKF
jgi:hypothetical protein